MIEFRWRRLIGGKDEAQTSGVIECIDIEAEEDMSITTIRYFVELQYRTKDSTETGAWNPWQTVEIVDD